MTIEESITQTGRRFVQATAAAHSSISPQLDATRGLPKDQATVAPTLRAIPEAAELPTWEERDENDVLIENWLLFSIEADEVQPADLLALEPHALDGSLVEITITQFEEKLNPITA